MGADVAVDYARSDFVEAVKQLTQGRGADIIFDREGKIVPDHNSGCTAGGTTDIDFSTPPKVRIYFPSRFVRYNAYYIYGSASGNLTTDQAKE